MNGLTTFSPPRSPPHVQGDTMRVVLSNDATAGGASLGAAPATNLHFHGFSVSPAHGQVPLAAAQAIESDCPR